MARRSGFQKVIDQKEWTSALHGRMATLDLDEGDVALGDIGILLTLPVTLLRTRGRVMMSLDSGGLNEHVSVAIGIIVVSENAFDQGAPGVPSPVTDGQDDWLWHDYMQVTSGEETAIFSDYLVDRISVDSKAMRKLRAGELLAVVAEVADSVDQGGNVTITYGFRQLLGF